MGVRNSHLRLNMCFGLSRIYLAFDDTFPFRVDGKVTTLNIYEVLFSCYFIIFHIYLAFDFTFPSPLHGKVMTLTTYDIDFSYKLSYMFSVRLHFPLTCRWKSDGDAKYIRGHILNI